MKFTSKFASFAIFLIGAILLIQGEAIAAEKRIALVIGNAAYEAKPLETTANDAGLIAQTLQAAGFDVTGARDLDEDSLRHAFRDFTDKAAAAGPDTVAFVYFAGYGLQLEGEDYLIPIGANISRDADIPSKATRVSDYVKSLAASGLKTGVVVLDAARANPFSLSGAPIASGLALQEPGVRMVLAYNAAPGTIAPAEKGPYGAYAHALSEMMREGGLPLKEVFDNVRLRVNEMTKGAQIPWNSPGAESSFVFFERAANAPPAPDQTAARNKPIAELGPKDGYAAAIQRDSLQGYEDYVATYPHDPSTKRVRAILAVRREALTWRRTRVADSPNAYWSYLRRYPRGPHVGDARRRLSELAAAYDPPPSFEMIDYDVPPPPEDEIVYVDRPVVMFDDPDFGFLPPPPPPIYFLPPPPPDFVVLPPPYIVTEAYALPIPVFVPIPVWQSPPPYIVPPPNNVIFENVHNQVIIDHAANNVVIKDPGGSLLSSNALKAVGVGAAAVAIGAALPAYVAKKANLTPPPGAPGVNPAALHQHQAPGAPLQPNAQQPLGANPAATLHTLPNAAPLPTPSGVQPLDKTLHGKPPIGAGAPPATGAPNANPAATLHTPPNGAPLPTPSGVQPLDKTLHGKPPIGAGAPPATGAPTANPASTLHTPPNAAPLPTPGGQPLDKPLHGKAVTGTPPSGPSTAVAPNSNVPAGPPSGTNKGLAPAIGQTPHPKDRAVGHAPNMNAPVGNAPATNAPLVHAPVNRAPIVRHAPPPAAVIHQPPPQVMRAPQPMYHAPTAPAFHQPPPQVMHAPQPAYRPAGPPPAAMHAPAAAFHPPAAPAPARAVAPAAPAKHCVVVNGAPVCK